MLCALQFAKLFDVSAFRQVTAETPSRAAVNGGLIKATSEVKWRVPVDPMSASASSPPNCPETIPLSGIPWKAGDPPNAVFQTFVPNVIHESEVKTVVPSGPIVTAGSLLPLFSNNGVFENAIEFVATGCTALTVELSMQRETATTNKAMNAYRIRRPPRSTPGEGKGPTNTFRERPKNGSNLAYVIRCESTDAYANSNAVDSRSEPDGADRDSEVRH